MLSDEEYTERELDGLNQWFQIEHDKLPEWPFSFYFAKFKSGSDELIELVMDPLNTLLGGGPAGEALKLPGMNESSKITTTLFGHERTLKARMMYAVAAVDDQDHSVSLTGHKAAPST